MAENTMLAPHLKTVEDLLQTTDEKLELINGALIKRPIARSEARSEHALAQSGFIG